MPHFARQAQIAGVRTDNRCLRTICKDGGDFRIGPARDAKTGAVTLQSNKIMNIVCTSSPTVEGGLLPSTGSDIYGLLMLGAFLVLVGVVGLRFRKRYE